MSKKNKNNGQTSYCHTCGEVTNNCSCLPADYEACAECGFDHSYEYNALIGACRLSMKVNHESPVSGASIKSYASA